MNPPPGPLVKEVATSFFQHFAISAIPLMIAYIYVLAEIFNWHFMNFNIKVNTYHISVTFWGVLFSAVSCNHKLKVLPDGWTRITTNTEKYRNRQLFNREILRSLDTNSIYRECCYIQNLDSSSLGLNKSKRYRSYSYPSQSRKYFRFYNDGYCNCFINDDVGDFYKLSNFNPEVTGFRGVYFQNSKDEIRIDLFTQTSGIGGFSNLKLYLKVSGDSLFMRSQNDHNSFRVFLKRELPNEIQSIKGWLK